MESNRVLEFSGVQFRPQWARPLGLEQLRAAFSGGPIDIDMVGHTVGLSKPIRVWGSITFDHPSPFLALVPGGVLRPELLPNASFALDRNVVCGLRLWHERGIGGAAWEAAVCWLNQPGMSSSPFLAALEGSVKRLPTYPQFCLDLDEIEAVTRAVLPAVDLLNTRKDDLREFMYESCVKFGQRGKIETKFLRRVNGFLKNSVAGKQRASRRDEILEIAQELGLKRVSLAVITTLARLYEAPSAQRVLKFGEAYTDEDAHNALADLHQLEVIAGCAARIPNPVLLTADKMLALLWAGLGVKSARFNERGVSEVRLNPYHLFAHLRDEECLAVASRLGEDRSNSP